MNILFAPCSLQFISLAFKISAFELLFYGGKLTYIKLGFFFFTPHLHNATVQCLLKVTPSTSSTWTYT